MALTIISTNAVNAALAQIAPLFEQESGCALSVSFSATRQIQDRIMRGETADVVIATATGIEELTNLGKLAAGSRTDLGSAGIGVGARAGARMPDISTVDAFRRTLIEAKSIAYATQGVGGLLLTQIAERFGIAEALRAKSRTIPGGLAGELVVRGEAELCVQMESEILAVEGCVLVGPLPPGLQQATVFAAALVSGTQHADAAKSFLSFLTSPAAARVLQAKGFSIP
jgi:molybdate transport system substrate-binding protein